MAAQKMLASATTPGDLVGPAELPKTAQFFMLATVAILRLSLSVERERMHPAIVCRLVLLCLIRQATGFGPNVVK